MIQQGKLLLPNLSNLSSTLTPTPTRGGGGTDLHTHAITCANTHSSNVIFKLKAFLKYIQFQKKSFSTLPTQNTMTKITYHI